METMRSVLRTIIGQHINLLTNGEPPARVHPPAPPILFVLDEMPQLKNMPPIANALVVGAGYGVKLWMFVQDVGQLKKEYPNAEGMMGNCAVRMYMNPDLADGTAQKLSDDIGFRESIVDGSRVKSWSRMCSRASNSRTRSSSGRAAWRVRPACRRISPISMKR
jgi:type IV secretion system protein VirD4